MTLITHAHQTYNNRSFIRYKLTAIACGILLTSTSLLTGCNKGMKPVQYEPSPLPTLAASSSHNTPSLRTITQVSMSEQQQDPLTLMPAWNANQLIVAGRQGEVTALSTSGQRQWKITVKDQITAGVSVTPELAVVSTDNGLLIGLDRQTGQLKWQSKLTASVLSAPLATNTHIVTLANDGTISAHATTTGKLLWQYPTQTAKISRRGSASPTLVAGNLVAVGSSDGRVSVFDLATGRPLWSQRLSPMVGFDTISNNKSLQLTDVDATPTADEGRLYVVGLSGQLMAVDLNERKVLFQDSMVSAHTIAVDDQAIYGVSNIGVLTSMDKLTGKRRWQQDKLKHRGLTNAVRLGDWLIVGDAEGYLHLLDPDTGAIVNRYRSAKAPIALSVQDNRLLLQTQSGDIAVLQLTSTR